MKSPVEVPEQLSLVKKIVGYNPMPVTLITIPTADSIYNPILAIIPLQLLAYHLSISRGFDPDYPRNLSKTLTVD